MVLFASISIAALSIVLGLLYWQFGSTPGSEFFIGVSGAYEHLPAYVLLVPIHEYGAGSLMGGLFATSAVGNLGVILSTYPAVLLIARRQQANFYRL